ncbi:acyclic terpene utilization AtuA family protein [Zavarzinia compransoris]|uniref:Terpene utilization protein AtuA n=1 Tax=Zavarzinia compransoris TaxID=1264899 RepID=A0A317E528_9PROT|nr:acyclic terpene utilization AtuA family protein [Zavarzinia compransoris]PWR20503.1 terpene utilization protein AtuA [Zavarzinia compransoris]TDP43850.1 uncharacterized protein DUF1446 [Zavarzinia compransoris]
MATARDSGSLRIGCASGFWGDSLDGTGQLVRHGAIDVLVFDWLAEITLSLLARVKAKKPEAGFVPDFVEALVPHLAAIKARGIRVVSNGGGMNPAACAAALAARARAAGIELKIATVTGDDLKPAEAEIRAARVRDMFAGTALPDKLVTANAYIGARAIAAALDAGAEVVITGRCVDSAVTLGPLVHHFGWDWQDWDRLAQGSLAGHLIECGVQGTGGIFTDWDHVPGWDDMGFPIVEVAADGSFVLTKPAGTGGHVVPLAVAEQLLYEIGDPAAYLLPDVACDFRAVRLEAAGPDRVRVSGARGRPATGLLKVSATVADGYRVIGAVTIAGREAVAKAERTGAAILARAARLAAERGLPPFAETSIEVLGSEATYGPHGSAAARASREVVLKLGARAAAADTLEVLAREIVPAATAMAQGLTGLYAGRPGVQPVFRTFSFLWPASNVPATVTLGDQVFTVGNPVPPPAPAPAEVPAVPDPAEAATTAVALIRLAVGRSGDKGNIANIGVAARKPAYLPHIRAALTPAAVKAWFAHLGVTRVERFDLPGFDALNFLLHDALGGGGVASIRIDPQGKALAQMLMDMPVPVPAGLLAGEAA